MIKPITRLLRQPRFFCILVTTYIYKNAVSGAYCPPMFRILSFQVRFVAQAEGYAARGKIAANRSALV